MCFSPVTRTAQLNEIVVLPCQSRSRLAETTWRFSNNTVLSQFPYVHQADNSLTFRVTPDTVSTYHCVSEELGFRQTIASFSVTLPVTTPRSFPHPSRQHPDVTRDSRKDTEMEPIPSDETLFDEIEPTEGKKTTAWTTGTDSGSPIQARKNPMNSAEKAVCISQKSYYAEMVAFCLLFVMCAFACIAFVVLWRHSMRCNKTAPEKDSEKDNICQTELEDKQTPNS